VITVPQAANLLATVIAVFALLTIGRWLYRSVAILYFRQALCALRDDLFDLAADGIVRFDDPAYVMLRTALNGLIRYADTLNWLTFLGLSVTWRYAGRDIIMEKSFWTRWTNATDQLPDPSRHHLCRHAREMQRYALIFIFFGTPSCAALTLPVLTLPLGIFVCMREWWRSPVTGERGLGDRVLDAVDTRAYDFGAAA